MNHTHTRVSFSHNNLRTEGGSYLFDILRLLEVLVSVGEGILHIITHSNNLRVGNMFIWTYLDHAISKFRFVLYGRYFASSTPL